MNPHWEGPADKDGLLTCFKRLTWPLKSFPLSSDGRQASSVMKKDGSEPSPECLPRRTRTVAPGRAQWCLQRGYLGCTRYFPVTEGRKMGSGLPQLVGVRRGLSPRKRVMSPAPRGPRSTSTQPHSEVGCYSRTWSRRLAVGRRDPRVLCPEGPPRAKRSVATAHGQGHFAPQFIREPANVQQIRNVLMSLYYSTYISCSNY